jgi:hypothetical protein
LHFVRAAKDVWYLPEKEISFDEVSRDAGDRSQFKRSSIHAQQLLAQPLPKLPRDVSIAGHWLAVEGVRPQVPENQVLATEEG